MHEALLETLAEPRMRSALTLSVTKHDDGIDEVSLMSGSSGRLEPIRRFVPQSAYTDAFGKHKRFTDEPRCRNAILDAFDMLSPRYDSPMTPKEIYRAFKNTDASSSIPRKVSAGPRQCSVAGRA